MSASPFDELLGADEKVLWSGAPSSEKLLMRNDYLLIPGGVLIGIVGLVGVIVSFSDQLDGKGSLLRLAIYLVCLVLGWQGVIGHTIRRRRRALATDYAVTDQRVIELRRGDDDQDPERREVAFESSPPVRVRPQYQGRATIEVGSLRLFNVEGATRIESLIRQQLPS